MEVEFVLSRFGSALNSTVVRFTCGTAQLGTFVGIRQGNPYV